MNHTRYYEEIINTTQGITNPYGKATCNTAEKTATVLNNRWIENYFKYSIINYYLTY